MTSNNPSNAIILAHEITKGMKSLGPKCLLPIHKNTTIIEHQIQYLKKYYPSINIYICTGFEHDKIVKAVDRFKNIQYYYCENYENINQAETIIKCVKDLNILDNVLILTSGLIPITKIPIKINKSSIQITDKSQKIPFDIGMIKDESISYLFYGLPFKWTESLFLSNEGINAILSISKNKNCNHMFLFELINLIIDNGTNIDIQYIDKNLPIKLNTIKDLAIIKKYYEKYMRNKIKR